MVTSTAFEEHKVLPSFPVSSKRSEYLPAGTTLYSLECGRTDQLTRDHKRLAISELIFLETPAFTCKGIVDERESVVPFSKSQRAT